MPEKPNIFIALPVYGSPEWYAAQSWLSLQNRLYNERVEHRFVWQVRTRIVMARNILASGFLASDCTHIFFLDDDIGIRPEALLRLIEADQPVIGCACPYRDFDPERYAEFLKTAPAKTALARSLRFNVRLKNNRIEYADNVSGAIYVDGIGTGALLVRRDAMAALARTMVPGQYQQHPFPVYNLFGEIEEDGLPFGEDYSFCLRWTKAGGQVLALIDEDIRHGGFTAKFTDLAMP